MKNATVLDLQNALATAPHSETAFIDVCSAQEYSQHHIAGVTNVPLETLPTNIETLKAKKVIYLHCLSGGRSKVAAQFLEANGVKADIYNVEGGLMAWHNAGLPLV